MPLYSNKLFLYIWNYLDNLKNSQCQIQSWKWVTFVDPLSNADIIVTYVWPMHLWPTCWSNAKYNAKCNVNTEKILISMKQCHTDFFILVKDTELIPYNCTTDFWQWNLWTSKQLEVISCFHMHQWWFSAFFTFVRPKFICFLTAKL